MGTNTNIKALISTITVMLASTIVLSCVIPTIPATGAGSGANACTLVVNIEDVNGAAAMATAARTVVPSFTGNAKSYTITCENTATGVSVSPSMTSLAAQTFPNLPPGEYKITVNSYNEAGSRIATGSSTVTLTEGATAAAYVQLKYAQTSGTGQGSFALTIKWPTASANGIDWTIDGKSTQEDLADLYSGATMTTGSITDSGGTSTVTLSSSNLPSGIHTVRINFKDTAHSTITGSQLEIVNVYDNMVSDQFVNADGSLSDSRTYTAAEVMVMDNSVSTDATVHIIAGTETKKLSLVSGTPSYSYNAGTTNVITVIPTTSVAGQSLSYTWTPSSGSAIAATVTASDAPLTFSVPVVKDTDVGALRISILTLSVVAPNNGTPQNYSISIRSPIHITDGANLATALASMDNNVVLDNDITLSAWLSIGYLSEPFYGTFNGNDHTISGMTVSVSTGDAGMFGVIKTPARISNVRLKNVSVTGGSTDSGTSGDGVGGLVGENYGGTITRCSVTGYVEGYQGVGGLVGINRADTNAPAYRSVISECYSTATVKATVQHPGGLVGWNYGTISNSYARSNIVNGGGGGLVDYNLAGGIIENCYAAGSGSLNGGFARLNAGTCTANYYDSTVSGMSDSIGATGVTTTAAKTQGTYSGWNFSSVWAINAATNSGYPYLTNNAQPSVTLSTDMTAAAFAALINADLAGDYVLGDSITLSGTITATSGFIGTTDKPFRGTFDGNGKILSNITIDVAAGNTGFFAYIGDGSIVKNLRLENVTTTGKTASSSQVGALAGNNKGLIYRCSSSGTITGANGVGGLVGNNQGTVEECWSNATVTADYYSGGLVGSNGTNNPDTRTGLIKNCYARGAVTVHWGGGLVGSNNGHGIVVNSYAACLMSHSGTLGGDSFVQVLIGNSGGTETDCFFDSSKIATSYKEGAAITSGYFGTPKDYTAIRAQSTYTTALWDFTSVWDIASGTNGGYPYLRNVTPTTDTVISTQAQLAAIGTNATTLAGDYYLTGTVTLSGDWTPIGPFTGNLDGNNQIISGLVYTVGDIGKNIGLFTSVGATGLVTNLKMENVNLQNADTTTSHQTGCIAATNQGTIANCSVLSGSLTGTWYVGGLVGINTGTIEYCSSRASVSGTSSFIGGICGSSSGLIRYSWSNGSVTGSDCVGGLIGYINGGTVSNCYSRAIVAMHSGGGRTAGFVGGLDSGTISNCYAAGSVTIAPSVTSLGGFAGLIQGGTISGCVFDTTSSGYTSGYGNQTGGSASITGYTTNQMKTSAPIATWDKTTVWELSTAKNSGYPYLQANAPTDDIQLTSAMTKDQLYNALNNNKNGTFVLTTDMPLSGDWNPIGTSGDPFTGTFDGGGHTISGLSITPTSSNAGFFGYTGATAVVKDLSLNITITGTAWSNIGVLSGGNYGTISRCTTSGSISGNQYVGGLVGQNNGLIDECSSSTTVTNGASAGGLVGQNLQGTIRNSCATGNVTGSRQLGGLVGVFNNGSIQTSYATGTVTGSGDYLGGFSGRIYNGTIDNCYARGAVAASTGNYLGGFSGSSATAVITKCYATGSVTYTGSPTSCGGFTGSNGSGTITGCFFLSTPDNSLGMYSPSGMTTSTTYTGYSWNLATSLNSSYVWGIGAGINNGYPYIQYFGAATVTP